MTAGWNLTGTHGAADGPREGSEEGVLSVSQAVRLAHDTLTELPPITVIGEVTGFKGPYGARGHCYFAIKDEESSVDCAIWGGVYKASPYELKNGLVMRFTGSFDIHTKTGRLKFIARSFAPVGEGLLRQKVDALARKLAAEGLTADSRKRRIPAFCTRVAVVTSLSGAVIDDVKRTLARRNPLVELVCVGSKVQGEGAEAELIEALSRAAAIEPAPDCILLVRGGGSYEDLMTFNDEALARAVASCPVPVVTGIGHEPDTSICDMVSDRRASTPTAAAESVAPSMTELADLLRTREERLAQAAAKTSAAERQVLDALAHRAGRAVEARLKEASLSLEALAQRPCMQGPDALIAGRVRELEMTSDRMLEATERQLARIAEALRRTAARMPEPRRLTDARSRELAQATARLAREGRGITRARASELATYAASLDALSPLRVLARGYAIAYADGRVASSATEFEPGAPMRVRLADGEVAGTVTGVYPADGA